MVHRQGSRKDLKSHVKSPGSKTSMKTIRQNKTIWWYESLLKYKLLLVVLMLGLSYLLGVWLRTLPAFSEQHVLTGDDPYVHLRYAEYLLNSGSLPSNDTLRYYPEGFDPRQELLLVPWFIAAFSWITGLQPLDIAIWLPAFFAPLIIVPIYFISKKITGSMSSGVIAAFLAASTPAFILRSFEGFCDKEAFTTPLMFAALTLAFISFNTIMRVTSEGYKKTFATSITLSLLSGVLIGVSALGWAGYFFTYLVLAAYALLMLFFGKDSRDLSLIFIPYLIIMVISGAFVASLTARYGGLSFLWSITFLVPIGASLPLIALRWLKRRFVIPLVITLIVAIVIVEWNYVAGLINWLFGSKGLIRLTVAESRQPTLFDLWNQVGFPIILAMFALVPRNVKDPTSRNNYLFLLSMFVVSAVLASSEIRLLMFLSLTASIMAGATLSRIIDYCSSKLLVKRKKRLELNEKALLGLALSIISTALVVSSTFAIPTYSIENGPITSHITIYKSLGMGGYSQWLQALDWLRGNTTSDAIVISWWDYGYLIQYYARRMTVVDPGNFYEWRNVVVAKFFMSSDEDEALNILNRSFGLEGKEVYVVVSLEEIPKSHAIAFIAGHPTPPFQLQLIMGAWRWVISDPNAILTRLVLGIEGLQSDVSGIIPSLKHFEKVYCNTYVAVY
ncbi:MAG: STT3 domain-containing protein, partial [Candidatus Nezhaarchaeales archaeon]